jgi:hypothetical protein
MTSVALHLKCSEPTPFPTFSVFSAARQGIEAVRESPHHEPYRLWNQRRAYTRDCEYRLSACCCNHGRFGLGDRITRFDSRQYRLLKSRCIGNRYAAEYDAGCAP